MPSDPFLLAHQHSHAIYTLSGRTPVGIRDQILRAHWLVERLCSARLLGEGTRVLVAGAGAAGVTAGVLAARQRADVLVIDGEPAPFSLQQERRTRWLDPVQYDWPAAHHGEARWPCEPLPAATPLAFEAARAHVIAGRWASVLAVQSVALAPCLQAEYGLELLLPPPTPGAAAGPLRVVLQETGPSPPPPVGWDADLVILARGAAYERVTVPQDADDPHGPAFTGHEFWSDDPFELPHLGLHPQTEGDVVVSGGGDGALQDYIRLQTGQPSALAVYKAAIGRGPHAETVDAWLRARLAEFEEQAHRELLWSSGRDADHAILQALHERHARALQEWAALHPTHWGRAASVLGGWAQARARRVRLVHPCSHFGVCYALNRFVALMLMAAARERGQPDADIACAKVVAVQVSAPSPKPADAWGCAHQLTVRLRCTCTANGQPGADDVPIDALGVVVRHGVAQYEDAPVIRQNLPRHLA